jgi:hypothetical protein
MGSPSPTYMNGRGAPPPQTPLVILVGLFGRDGSSGFCMDDMFPFIFF